MRAPSLPFRLGTVECSLPVGDPLLEVTSAELLTFHASGSQVSSPVFVLPGLLDRKFRVSGLAEGYNSYGPQLTPGLERCSPLGWGRGLATALKPPPSSPHSGGNVKKPISLPVWAGQPWRSEVRSPGSGSGFSTSLP